jgi:hypothetical protein
MSQGVGEDEPGTENRTTFLPFHSLLASYSWGRPQAVGSESVIGAHLYNVSAGSWTGAMQVQYMCRWTGVCGEAMVCVLEFDAFGERIADLEGCHFV